MVRLRQVALVAARLEPAVEALHALGLGAPFADPGVGTFGLRNGVLAAGRDFVEVVSPARDQTTAGRYLERRGGDAGYMAIFQVDDVAAARSRVAALGVRVVWTADLDDIAGTHLHPKDVPGAIVSIDEARPAESWRWAGPDWTGGSPADARDGGIVALEVEVPDPSAAAARWASILGLEADGDAVALDDQRIVFRPGDRGITGVALAIDGVDPGDVDIGSCGVNVLTGDRSSRSHARNPPTPRSRPSRGARG